MFVSQWILSCHSSLKIWIHKCRAYPGGSSNSFELWLLPCISEWPSMQQNYKNNNIPHCRHIKLSYVHSKKIHYSYRMSLRCIHIIISDYTQKKVRSTIVHEPWTQCLSVPINFYYISCKHSMLSWNILLIFFSQHKKFIFKKRYSCNHYCHMRIGRINIYQFQRLCT
jgi:hypothetical protein